jgi:hypothetical protein
MAYPCAAAMATDSWRQSMGLKLNEGFLNRIDITPRIEEDIIYTMGTEQLDKGFRPIIDRYDVFH